MHRDFAITNKIFITNFIIATNYELPSDTQHHQTKNYNNYEKNWAKIFQIVLRNIIDYHFKSHVPTIEIVKLSAKSQND